MYRYETAQPVTASHYKSLRIRSKNTGVRKIHFGEGDARPLPVRKAKRGQVHSGQGQTHSLGFLTNRIGESILLRSMR